MAVELTNTDSMSQTEDHSSAYRAFFALGQQRNVKELVVEQLHAWLSEKGWDPRLERTGFHQQGDAELFILHHENSEASTIRARLIEPSILGEWRTQLTLSETRGGGGWLRLTVKNSEGRFVDVPRIAAYILDVVDGFDGPVPLVSGPRHISSPGVDSLLEYLYSDDREGPIIVAATGDDQTLFQAFCSRVTTWTRQVRGLAHVVILDPNATRRFALEAGTSHSVSPWTIRTFQPYVDPTARFDGRRHRTLSTSALGQRPDSEITRLLGRVARAHAATRSLPDAVMRISRALARLETREVVSALGATGSGASPISADRPDAVRVSPIAPDTGTGATDVASKSPENVEPGDVVPTSVFEEAAEYLARIEMVRSTLGIVKLDEASLRELAERARRGAQIDTAIARIERQLAEKQARIDDLKDEVAVLRASIDDEQLERAVAEEEQSRLADQVRWLRKKLVEAREFDAAYGEVPDSAYTIYPNNFCELLDRSGELSERGVILCADPKPTSDLDEYDTLGNLVCTAWESLLVLCDYVRARRNGAFDLGLDSYLKRTPSGYRQMPPNKYAETESRRTMDAYGSERVFPMPTDVEISGNAVMKAHFKLGKVGMISPRMYLLDRYPRDGKIYVGYLGAHLTNTKTN